MNETDQQWWNRKYGPIATEPTSIITKEQDAQLKAYLAAIDNKYLEESSPKYKHYFKDVSNLDYIDIYRVLKLWEVTDPCLQHAVKKILVAGNRGHKDIQKDIQEAIDSLERWKSILEEDNKENL